MLIEIRAAPPFMKNGFVLADETTREGVVIDPGDDVEDLLEVVRDHELRIQWILLTHAHFDHITGVKRARGVLGSPVVLHEDDLALYRAAKQQGIAFGFRVEPQPEPDRFYQPGDVFRFGGHEIRAHHTPGHSPGGVCLAVTAPGPDGQAGAAPKTLVVGDTLFAGSIGRTDLPGGDMDTLLASIRNVLFAFGDDAVVYPGHGEPTTIGQERRTNPFLR
jgi:glyoxylase-like metal-dependent hydrolase (beta-lactamase superfamily II)